MTGNEPIRRRTSNVICAGSGQIPPGVQLIGEWGSNYISGSNTRGTFSCPICGQMVQVDGFGRMVLHGYGEES
jgi:hypothetical protein